MGRLAAKLTNERREKVWFLMLKGHRQQEIADILHVSHVTIYNDIKFLTNKSKQYIYDMAKGTHVLLYQRAIEGIGLVLSECWKVYNADNPQINYFHKMAALKLAKECNSEMMNLTINGPTYLSVSRITERANRLGLLSDKEPLTETDEMDNYMNMNKRHEHES